MHILYLYLSKGSEPVTNDENYALWQPHCRLTLIHEDPPQISAYTLYF